MLFARKLRNLRLPLDSCAADPSRSCEAPGISASALEEAFGRSLVAQLLFQNVEFRAMFVDRTP
jgi:hypothetical protein